MPADLLSQIKHAHERLAAFLLEDEGRDDDAARPGEGAAGEVGGAQRSRDLHVGAGLGVGGVLAEGGDERVREDVGVYGGGGGVGRGVEVEGFGVGGGGAGAEEREDGGAVGEVGHGEVGAEEERRAGEEGVFEEGAEDATGPGGWGWRVCLG